jgi:hypothetical protein
MICRVTGYLIFTSFFAFYFIHIFKNIHIGVIISMMIQYMYDSTNLAYTIRRARNNHSSKIGHKYYKTISRMLELVSHK